MTISGKTTVQILDDVLEDLARPSACCFQFCPGPDKAFVQMATCVVCASTQDLRKLRKRLTRAEKAA
jgi:hypothetical protein